MSIEEMSVGGQRVTPRRIEYLDHESLEHMYNGAVKDIAGTHQLADVHPKISTLLHDRRNAAMNELAQHGVEMETPEVRYVPLLEGSQLADDGAIEIGRPGRADRTYYVETQIAHEALHKYVRDEHGVDEYTPEEEALAQVWSLYLDDILETEDGELHSGRDEVAADEVEQRLDATRDRYNDHGSMPDGFGDDLYDHATDFVETYYSEDGAPEARMTAVLDYGFDSLSE